MNDEINYQNNPLHGLSLKNLLTDIVDHYGFELLYAYLNINCFNARPSIESSVKFLKKTEWAREKVEVFYLYEFKNLPRASASQFELPPRDRIVPEDQVPGEPAELSFEDAERLQEKRAKKAAERAAEKRQNTGSRSGSRSSSESGYSAPSRSNSSGYAMRKERDSEYQPAASTPAASPSDPWANAKSKNSNKSD